MLTALLSFQNRVQMKVCCSFGLKPRRHVRSADQAKQTEKIQTRKKKGFTKTSLLLTYIILGKIYRCLLIKLG